jgi:transposase
MKEVYYVGLDVHKGSIQMAILDSRKKEPIVAKGLPNRTTRVVKELTGYQKTGKVQIAYEAGCLGYTLYRELSTFGYDCRVIPPATVFHGGDGAVKTDYRDAVDIM